MGTLIINTLQIKKLESRKTKKLTQGHPVCNLWTPTGFKSNFNPKVYPVDTRFSSVQFSSVQFSSVQSLSHVRLFATPWMAACQASLSITNCLSLLKHIIMLLQLLKQSTCLNVFCIPTSVFLFLFSFFAYLGMWIGVSIKWVGGYRTSMALSQCR